MQDVEETVDVARLLAGELNKRRFKLSSIDFGNDALWAV